MYTKQLLIKMDEDLLKKLKKMAEKMGLKLSSFARMVLKNYVQEENTLTKEDIEDIKEIRAIKKKGTNWHDWEEVKKELLSD